MRSLPLIVAALIGVAAPAHADDAEVLRLREEVALHTARTRWAAAERAFAPMEVYANGVPARLHVEDWLTGAAIARNLGDMAAVQRRLAAAFDLQPTDDLRGELQTIAATYGPLRVEVAPAFAGTLGLTPEVAPFESDKRRFIDTAAKTLEEGRAFDGLVPIGRYTIAGTAVEVTTGAIDTLRVRIDGEGAVTTDRVRPGGASEAPGLEPFASLGAGFASLTAAARGVGPEAFSGLGLRVGAGVDAWLAPRIGVRVEFGYHNLLAGGGKEVGDGLRLPGNAVHQGYVWLGGTWRAGPLDIAVGPQLGFGVATASGLDGEAWAARCASTPEEATCRGLEQATDEDLASASLRGRVLTLGGTAGASWELRPREPVGVAIGLEGGGVSDGARVLPWAQLGVTVRLQEL